MSQGPLAGVRIIDLSRVLAGPYATMMMADLGADVVKVEPPWGDETRDWGPPWIGDQSAYFLSINRGKRSIDMDLTDPEDRQRFLALIDSADVVVENFRTGQLERWGLGFEDVLAVRNPRLLLASLSAFGRTGPARDLPGYATLVEARSGLMSITGFEDGPPTKSGVALVDILAGCHLMHAVSTALYARERTGRGRRIDVSLLESAMSSLTNQAGNFLLDGTLPNRAGNDHPNIVPYGTFEAADRTVMVAVGNDNQYRRFCELLGQPELGSDPRFTTNSGRVTHREELIPLLADAMQRRTADEWISEAIARGIPLGPVNTIAEAFSDEQVRHQRIVHDVMHPTLGRLRTVRHPVLYDGRSMYADRHPPELGEHRQEILAELDGGTNAR